MIKGEHAEVPGHELDDRSQSDHGRADADAGKAELRDRRVDDAHLAEFLEEAFRDFIRTLIHADFFPHEEDTVVPLHLLTEGLVQGVAICKDGHEERC